MYQEDLQSDLLLKKSPFLVVKQLDGNEVRIYSKLQGNLTSFAFDINGVLKVFESPIDVKTAGKKVSEILRSDSSVLIKELYEKQFLVEAGKTEKDMLSEYIGTVRDHNKTPKVSKVTFLTSSRCNLACKGCYHNFYDFKSTDMSSDFAGNILEGLFPYLKKSEIPVLVISFLGYEPLLNFETLSNIFDQACSMGEKYDIKTSFQLFTNAYDLREQIFQWIEQNKSTLEIKVSLDGIKEDNDKRRVDFAGSGTYDSVVENLKRIISTGVECGVLTVLSRLNFDNIEKFVDEMAAIGVKRITANIFCGQSTDERLVELSDLEKIEAIKRMDMTTEKYGIDFDGEWKFAVIQMVTGAHFSCPAGIKQLVFSADGVIYPCQRFAGTEMNFGTYREGFWEKLTEGQCEGYAKWTDDLYDGVAERMEEEKTIDLTGWSCPFLQFLRGECISKNLEREFNRYLLEYYITRPLNRILPKSTMDCFSH